MKGRDFVVGDIHGCFKLLEDGLKYEGFDRRNDRLFSVGDIIDRGQDSEKCLKLLQEPWFHMVLGNHEEMMIEACQQGTSATWWASYGSWAKWKDPEEMMAWARRFEQAPISMTIECDGFLAGICHAEPDGQDWESSRDNERSRDVMLWGRRVLNGKSPYDVEGVDITIHGHTPLDKPKWVGNRYFMDTGACESGVIALRKLNDVFEEYKQRQALWG